MKAKNFFLNSQLGSEMSLDNFKDKKIVLFFYPKDNTPGWIIEAKDFQEKISEFEKYNTQVLGISKDSIKSHIKFANLLNLTYPLLSDSEGEICNIYDVLKEKSMFGKKYLGIERATFLINEKREIVREWRKVSIAGHVDEVINEIKKIEEAKNEIWYAAL